MATALARVSPSFSVYSHPLTPKMRAAAVAAVIPARSIKELTLALSVNQEEEEREKGGALLLGRRLAISACFTALTLPLCGAAGAAILEADDDEELLERVKKDRQKRLQRQGVISSSDKETGYLQQLVYKLSKVGQAIESNDFSAAGSFLGPSTDADWVQSANIAFTKFSSKPEEKTEVDVFNSSLASLISSVDKHDVESSKLAFVSSASALEKWIGLTGLVGQLKGL